MREQISNYIRAGYSGLYLVSPEEQRVEAEIKAIAEKLGFGLQAWSVTQGLVDLAKGTIRPAQDALEVLLAVRELPEKSIVLLRDYHLFLGGDVNPVLLGQLKDTLREAKTQSKVLVILGCRLCLPPELEREITVIDFKLPDKAELGAVLDGIMESAKLQGLPENVREVALNAACGLTTGEAENAFALSVVQTGGISPEAIARVKAQSLKRSGLLEVIETKESLATIGGLDLLKAWLLTRREAFSERARAYGLPSPKGLLIVGIPGTGKSLTAKATAGVFKVPLLKLDAGRIFAGLVGQSESNLRSVIQTAEAIAPCVLWIDELDKGFAGSKSSGASDGGTSARVFGSLLSWLQEKSAPVFVVATANDVTQLPPELLRKGRWDELFFVDLPSEAERELIWTLQIEKHGRQAGDFDLRQLAKASEGLTGSEIEAVFVEAMHAAFETGSEPNDLTIAQALCEFVPLSKLMGEQLGLLQKWAVGRTRMATAPVAERKLRKFAA